MRTTWDHWKSLEEHLDEILRDALYLAGFRHVISEYANAEEGRKAGARNLKEDGRGLAELLDDLTDDIVRTKDRLAAYLSINGIKGSD